MAKDPVCDMEVDEKNAAATSEHEGTTYYFCALGCKKAFDNNPEKYLTGEAPAEPCQQPSGPLRRLFRRLWK